MFPDLLKDISPELKKHMQGKSCFNFKKVEPELLEELDQLTKKSFERLMKEEYS
jgi:flagellar motor switch protein FliG